MAIYAVESVVDELCQELKLDPLDVRLMNAADAGTKASYGVTFDQIGLKATLEAAGATAEVRAAVAADPNATTFMAFLTAVGAANKAKAKAIKAVAGIVGVSTGEASPSFLGGLRG